MAKSFINVVVSGRPAFKAGVGDYIVEPTQVTTGGHRHLQGGGATTWFRKHYMVLSRCSSTGKWMVIESRTDRQVETAGSGTRTTGQMFSRWWWVKGYTLTSLEAPPDCFWEHEGNY